MASASTAIFKVFRNCMWQRDVCHSKPERELVATIFVPRSEAVYDKITIRPVLEQCMARIIAECIDYDELNPEVARKIAKNPLQTTGNDTSIDDLLNSEDIEGILDAGRPLDHEDRAMESSARHADDGSPEANEFEGAKFSLLVDLDVNFPIPEECSVAFANADAPKSKVELTDFVQTEALLKIVLTCVPRTFEKTEMRQDYGGWAIVGECTDFEPFGGVECG
jgi:hypothetical protein